MRPQKNSSIVFAILVMMGFISAKVDTPGPVRWLVLKDCTVTVNGSTNINKFSCSIPGYEKPDTVTFFRNLSGTTPIQLNGLLNVPVISFDCRNSMMTNDLRKTLKAKEFPTLNIYFVSLQKYPELVGEQESITGVVNIELAGVSKKIVVNYTFSMNEQKVIHLVGTQSVRFSDFNLIPPRKLGGMIRADDRLDVIFNIHFRRIEEVE